MHVVFDIRTRLAGHRTFVKVAIACVRNNKWEMTHIHSHTVSNDFVYIPIVYTPVYIVRRYLVENAQMKIDIAQSERVECSIAHTNIIGP